MSNSFDTNSFDTSSFDTTSIEKNYLKYLVPFLDDYETRMIRFLLTNTNLKIKINHVEKESVESNIGSPRGDGLSNCFFYLLKCLVKNSLNDYFLDLLSRSAKGREL